MNRWTVIVSGGMLEEEFARSVLENPEIEFIIGVDRGLEFLYRHEICPNYIVGDFDSVSGEILGYYEKETKVPIRKFNPVKDASDTEIALRLCLDLGRKNILILGATGNRIDHIWANVQCLKSDWMQEQMCGSWTVVIGSGSWTGRSHFQRKRHTDRTFRCFHWERVWRNLILRARSIR